MRLQSEIKIAVKDKVIGGSDPLICLPLVAKNQSDLFRQAEELKSLTPDLLEWRIDAYDTVEEIDSSIDALKALKKVMGAIPLILTCRIDSEGGLKKIPPEARLELITAAIASGIPEMVDVELCNASEFIEAVKMACQNSGTKLILSYHNFTETPTETLICNKLVEAQDKGADIAKVAVMPKDYADVLTLLSATNRARTGAVKIPMMTISMGPEGAVTRLAGGLFGSDITFAIGQESSAPGQIHIGDLRKAMPVLYR
jgi:3-dehydroquinate dehydratase-1